MKNFNFKIFNQSLAVHLSLQQEIMAASGLILGLNKGHKTEQKAVVKARSAGALSKRAAFVRSVVKEVAGLAPYEKRAIELIRNAGEKRAKKFCKKRLGTQKRAKAKVEELNNVITSARKH